MINDSKERRSIVHVLNEAATLSRIQRSGFSFLGSGHQSVAEHSFSAATLGFVLSKYADEPVNELRVLQLCLFHDYHEARIGDHNYVQKKYIATNTERVFEDIKASSPLGGFIVEAIKEFEEEITIEAKLARDADQLELLVVLKKELDTGNKRAQDWFDIVEKRLITQTARQLAREILKTPFDEWWIVNKNDPHWVSGTAQK